MIPLLLELAVQSVPASASPDAIGVLTFSRRPLNPIDGSPVLNQVAGEEHIGIIFKYSPDLIDRCIDRRYDQERLEAAFKDKL